MNSAVHRLINSVTGKSSLNECSIDELEQLAVQYPYFGPAQFLLARKLKEESLPQCEEQSRKALLYFHDQMWYDYLARDEQQYAGVVVPAAPAEAAEEPATGNNAAVEETAAPTPTGTIVSAEGARVPEEQEVQPEVPEETNTLATEQEAGAPDILGKFHFKPIDAADTALLFEPYHTVDYFASQGIRSAETEKPKDQFSQQLKSFTEWLKAMKRLPDGGAAARPSAGEQKVEQMAERSLADREIITEAMADVWEQQGNREKAIDTYRKLSLINPGKSAYFAAKIEHLKHL